MASACGYYDFVVTAGGGRRPAINHRSVVVTGGQVAGLDQASRPAVAGGLDRCRSGLGTPPLPDRQAWRASGRPIRTAAYP